MPIRQNRSSVPRSRGILILGSSGTASSISTGTSEVALGTVTIPGGLVGPNDRIRVMAQWSHTTSGNNKIMRVRLGGLSGTAFASATVTTTINSQTCTFITANNSRTAQKSAPAALNTTAPFGSGSTAAVSAAIDMAADTTLVLTGQPASGGETVTLEAYTVELIPGV